MKLIYAVIDGMGDLPIGELDGKTPLEFAETPNLDFLARKWPWMSLREPSSSGSARE